MEEVTTGAADPITGVANAFGDVARLITKALPGEEEQLERFKMRSPKIYARIMNSLFHRDRRFLRWNKSVDIDTHVDLMNGNLSESVRALLKKELHDSLRR